ncbi:MAG TPA: hypothetical protein VEK56_07660 [Vicinamibacterales bacterium]|nr:hypothetical protein [Vicinamibacterales bacterium]
MRRASIEIRQCHQRAKACRERAMRERDPAARRVMLDLEKRWHGLAQSIQLTVNISNFAKTVTRDVE